MYKNLPNKRNKFNSYLEALGINVMDFRPPLVKFID